MMLEASYVALELVMIMSGITIVAAIALQIVFAAIEAKNYREHRKRSHAIASTYALLHVVERLCNKRMDQTRDKLHRAYEANWPRRFYSGRYNAARNKNTP